jgi:UDP-N-acetylglucosamine--dolichyl-phosphate N-acetylglucosaminephosphotransferase
LGRRELKRSTLYSTPSGERRASSVIELIAPLLVSTLTSKMLLDWWVNVARRLGFVGRDMNKPGEVYVVEAGGIWVILATTFGVMTFIAIERYTEARLDVIPLLAITMTLLLAGLLGFFDDVLGWKRGITPLKRVLLTIPVALPLVVVKAGTSVVELPFIGLVELGLLYPLLVVPVGVVGAANAFNMIAGYNGLESTQAALLLAFALILAVLTGRWDAIYVIAPALGSILVFLALYNRYPAKCFPGNSFTYGVGAFYASLAIYWNFEKYALMSYSLYFLELLLFIRGLVDGVYKENFGRVLPDGSLAPPYAKSYSVTHLAIKAVTRIKGRCREVDVVAFIATLQALVSLIALLAALAR